MNESILPNQKERIEDFKQTCLQPKAIDNSIIAIVLLIGFVLGCGILAKASF